MKQLTSEKTEIIESKPSEYNVKRTNFFRNPDYNFTTYESYIKNSEDELSQMEDLISLSRYNSAMATESSISKNLKMATEHLNNEKDMKRTLEWKWKVMIVVLVAIIAIFIGKNRGGTEVSN